MDFAGNQAIYLQIADVICEKILLGQWREHCRIASVRELAMSIEVNPNTVMRSFSYLQEKGIIYNKRGIGFFVTAGAPQIITGLKREEFKRNDMISLFKKMTMLDISFEDLQEWYTLYITGECNEDK